jgi:hypothetical protein
MTPGHHAVDAEQQALARPAPGSGSRAVPRVGAVADRQHRRVGQAVAREQMGRRRIAVRPGGLARREHPARVDHAVHRCGRVAEPFHGARRKPAVRRVGAIGPVGVGGAPVVTAAQPRELGVVEEQRVRLGRARREHRGRRRRPGGRHADQRRELGPQRLLGVFVGGVIDAAAHLLHHRERALEVDPPRAAARAGERRDQQAMIRRVRRGAAQRLVHLAQPVERARAAEHALRGIDQLGQQQRGVALDDLPRPGLGGGEEHAHDLLTATHRPPVAERVVDRARPRCPGGLVWMTRHRG